MTLNIRPGKYATFGALINDTRDNLFDPKLRPNDAYVIELDGGIDVDGREIHADDTVVFDGKNWRLYKLANGTLVSEMNQPEIVDAEFTPVDESV